MAIRRLSRLRIVVPNNSSGSLTTNLTENWTTQATETYDATDPAASPSSWGTDPEKANLDREFDATGSLKQHLGALLTFAQRPDLAFYGAQIKIQPTYGVSDTPKLEIWTHDTANGWTRQRRLDLTRLCRSGETIIVDLLFNAISTLRLDKVWVTLAPTTTETLDWVVLHLYGDCIFRPGTPDCPFGSDPPDCAEDCSALFDEWVCDPDDGTPPAWTGLPPIPTPADPTPAVPFAFPPIIVDVPMPTTYVKQSSPSGWNHSCPTPNHIVMYFSLRKAFAQVRVTPFNSPVTFAEGTSQTITGDGIIVWTVSEGFGPINHPLSPSLPPAQITPNIRFLLTPINATVLDLLDWETFLFFFTLAYVDVC